MVGKKEEKVVIEFSKDDCIKLISMCSFVQFDGRYFDKETCAYLLSFFTGALNKLASSEINVKCEVKI